ncbi:MAG: hypothetical protein FWG93_02975 [Oscillospiraceae bacterium]|nr:hypothetical protein [Oscillospiraceae bacterium]
MKKISWPLMAAALLIFGACALPSPNAPEPAGEPLDVTENVPAAPSDPPYEAPDETLYFYVPSSEAFGLEGMDAALYDAAVTGLISLPRPYGELRLLTLTLLGAYPSSEAVPSRDDGGVSYVLRVDMHVYNGIYPEDWTQTEHEITFAWFCRITLAEEDGQWRAVHTYVLPDGGDPAEKGRMLWGPIDGPIYEYSDETLPPPIRVIPAIPATDHEGILKAYLDYFR